VRRERSQLLQAIVSVLLIAAATVVYYVIPVPAHIREGSWIILFSCGVVVLGLLIVLAVARLLRAGEQARVRGLVLLLTLSVLFFSYADESVARLPGQFVSLSTKTDALYFNVSTLATVGFGDVHAVGQLARVAVTLQIVFNLIFLGAAVSVIASFFRTRARGRYTGGSGTSGSASGPSAAGPSATGGADHAAEPDVPR
jgi:voltage-gated potassium channel